MLNSKTATVSSSSGTEGTVSVTVSDTQSGAVIIRVPVDESWENVKIVQGTSIDYARVFVKGGVSLIDFSMLPNVGAAVLTPVVKSDENELESDFGITLDNGIKVDVNYFPGFVRKSVTFTIDDGNVTLDRHFLEIMREAGILGTFNLININSLSPEEYRALYDGYEVASHHQLHALSFRDDFDYSLIEFKNEVYTSSSNPDYIYKDGSVEGLYWISYHHYDSKYNKGYWHPIATDEAYGKYIDITEEQLESVFGEGTVVGFAYPHGCVTAYPKAYLQAAGYLYARKTGSVGSSTNFAMPSDRFAWSYNADSTNLINIMERFDALMDDGELKFFSFGVHSSDYQSNWALLEEFAEKYGSRPEDFYYASNRDIFLYEDAVKALVIGEECIVNGSDIAVYVTVDGRKVIIPAHSSYYYSGEIKLNVTFDADNATEQTVQTIGVSGKATEPTAPERVGFDFDGWYLGEEKWDFDRRLTHGITLTARYTPHEFESSSAEVLPVKGGAGGIVAIIHDDGRSASGLLLDKLYLDYSLVGDVAMLTSNIYTSSGQTNLEYLKWKAILDTGRWGLISHSYTHNWWGTATDNGDGTYTLTDDEELVNKEIVLSQTILRNLFPGRRVLTFAYPGFSSVTNQYGGGNPNFEYEVIYNEQIRALIDEYYISARYYSEKTPTYVTEDAEWSYLDGYFLNPSNIASDTGLRARLESAANDGRIHLISVHGVSRDVKSGEWDGYFLSEEDMEKACRLISEYVSDGRVWNAHYEDAILYVREAQSASVSVTGDESGLAVTLTDTLPDGIYNYPLTVRVTVPGAWSAVKITQGENTSYSMARYLDGKWFIDAELIPDAGAATLTAISPDDIPKPEVKVNKPTPNNPIDGVYVEGFNEYVNGFGPVSHTMGGEGDSVKVTADPDSENASNRVLEYVDGTTSGASVITVGASGDSYVNGITTFKTKIFIKETGGGYISSLAFKNYAGRDVMTFFLQVNSTKEYAFFSTTSSGYTVTSSEVSSGNTKNRLYIGEWNEISFAFINSDVSSEIKLIITVNGESMVYHAYKNSNTTLDVTQFTWTGYSSGTSTIYFDDAVVYEECRGHIDEDVDRVCDRCENVYYDPETCVHKDDNLDAVCDLCTSTYYTEPTCPGHEDKDGNSECDICGAEHIDPLTCRHSDRNGDSLCDKCESLYHDPLTCKHEDENADDVCDKCKKYLKEEPILGGTGSDEQGWLGKE